jgi:hypothetical protein
MRNVLFVLGGGLLVYWYMCNSKSYGCNCQGDTLKEIGDELESGLQTASKSFKDAILQKDGSAVKPNIVSSGVALGGKEDINEVQLMPEYSEGGIVCNNLQNARKNIRQVYRRFNTKKSATVSPSRVKVIVVE